MVGIVAAPCCNHGGTGGTGLVREDFRRRIGTGKDNGILIHGGHHLGGDGSRRTDSNEHVGSHQCLRQGSRLPLQVGDGSNLLLDGIHVVGTPLVDGAAPVAEGDVSKAAGQKEAADGDGGSPSTIDDDADSFLCLSHQLEGIQQTRQSHHSGAVLVVVEDGNVAFFLELPLNLEAAGSSDVLKVHTAKAAGNQVDGVDDFVHILALDAQGKGIHAAEFLEQHALAFHNRHSCLRPDVPQPQHGSSICHHQAQIVAAGELIALVHILLDCQTWLCHTGSVGQGHVLPRFDRHLGHHLQLALPLAMPLQRLFRIIHAASYICSYQSTIFFPAMQDDRQMPKESKLPPAKQGRSLRTVSNIPQNYSAYYWQSML